MDTKSPAGQTLVLSVLLLSLIVVGTLALLSALLADRQAATTLYARSLARDAADAGIDRAIWCLNHAAQCAQPYLGETGNLTNGEYETTISTPSSTTRIVESTGYVPSKANARTTRSVRVTLSIDSTDVAFNYGVQAGIGGVHLGENAYINGNVYASGSVDGANNSYITGDVILTPSSPTLDAVSDPSVSPLTTAAFGNAGSTVFLAQSFIPSVSDRIYSIDLKIAKHLSPTSTLTLRVYSDSSGTPDQNLSGNGQVLVVSIPNDTPLGWENGWTNQTFNPSTNPILVAGQTYWLVLEVSKDSSTKYWTFVHSTTDAGYAGGTAKLDGDLTAMPAACAGGCDIAFRMNMGGVAPTLNVLGKAGVCGGAGVCGDGRARIVKSTTIGSGKKVYYQELIGTVKANGGSVTCSENDSGPYCFDNSPDEPPANFPISDAQIAQMKAQAAAGDTISSAGVCEIADGSVIGPAQYNCDVNLNGTVTLAGTVWVNGNITITNNAILKLDPAFATSSGVIIADYPTDVTAKGRITLSNNGNICGTNCAVPNDTYIMAISTFRDPIYATPSIDVSNNLTAAVLYAPYGMATISNNASLKEVTAQRIDLQNNASIIYESGLADVNFSSGPGASWIVRPGSYQTL